MNSRERLFYLFIFCFCCISINFSKYPVDDLWCHLIGITHLLWCFCFFFVIDITTCLHIMPKLVAVDIVSCELLQWKNWLMMMWLRKEVNVAIWVYDTLDPCHVSNRSRRMDSAKKVTSPYHISENKWEVGRRKFIDHNFFFLLGFFMCKLFVGLTSWSDGIREDTRRLIYELSTGWFWFL